MIHFFTSQRFVFNKGYNSLPSNSHLLVFEPTISGYRQVLTWLKTHPSEIEIYRVVIPIIGTYIDVGDLLIDNQPYEYASKSQECEIVQILRENTGEWPRKTQHCMFDFEQSKRYLEDWALLPDAHTGLSRVQTLMVGHNDRSIIVPKIIDLFFITKTQANDAWELLQQGQVKYTIPHFPFPHVVINGPYPLDVGKVMDNMISYINTGKLTVNWSSIPLAKLNCPVVGGMACCQVEDGEIIRPPYGTSVQNFYTANAHLCTSVNPMRFSIECDELITRKLQWNPQFADGISFSSVDDYMAWWMPEMKERMKRFRGDAELEHHREEVKCEFIRTLWLGSQVESASGKLIRAFYDENEPCKRARIDRYYNQQQDLLDTKIVEIEQGQAMKLRNNEFHESSSDYWIYLLKKVHNLSL